MAVGSKKQKYVCVVIQVHVVEINCGFSVHSKARCVWVCCSDPFLSFTIFNYSYFTQSSRVDNELGIACDTYGCTQP